VQSLASPPGITARLCPSSSPPWSSCADAAVWRRLGRTGEQTLTAALDTPDSDALYPARPRKSTRKRNGSAPPNARRAARCARGAGRCSPTSAGRRPPRAAEPGGPAARLCAGRATPTTSPDRRPPPKPPGSRFPHSRAGGRPRAGAGQAPRPVPSAALTRVALSTRRRDDELSVSVRSSCWSSGIQARPCSSAIWSAMSPRSPRCPRFAIRDGSLPAAARLRQAVDVGG
jgi:hypothetical protein